MKDKSGKEIPEVQSANRPKLGTEKDDIHRLNTVGTQCRDLAEKLESIAEKLGEGDCITRARMRGWYEGFHFMADWILLEKQNPGLHIISITGPSLSDLVMPHIHNFALTASLIGQRESELRNAQD